MKLLTEGLNNWKLRLILSALLCIMGLAAMVSMLLGLFIELSVFDKSIVSIAIFMVGIPTYLILSGLANIDENTIIMFLNEEVDFIHSNVGVLLKSEFELTEEEQKNREELELVFSETPLYKFLPDKPVKQAYFLMLTSMIISYGVWFLG